MLALATAGFMVGAGAMGMFLVWADGVLARSVLRRWDQPHVALLG